MNVTDLGRLAEMRRLVATGEAKERRVAEGLGLSEVGDTCGVDASTVWRWENRRRVPRGQAALRYARVLEMLAHRTERAS